jgi:uncharacterized protein (TIGR03083 family)
MTHQTALVDATGQRTGNPRADRVLAQLDAAWRSFQEAYAGLDDETLLTPGVTGDWSIRDLIAHVTWWDEESIKHLPVVLAGQRLARYSDVYGGIDAFNALMTRQKAGLSLDEVRATFVETHARLVHYLLGLDPLEWVGNPRFRHRLKMDTWSHYPIHEADIRRWREAHGLS